MKNTYLINKVFKNILLISLCILVKCNKQISVKPDLNPGKNDKRVDSKKSIKFRKNSLPAGAPETETPTPAPLPPSAPLPAPLPPSAPLPAPIPSNAPAPLPSNIPAPAPGIPAPLPNIPVPPPLSDNTSLTPPPLPSKDKSKTTSLTSLHWKKIYAKKNTIWEDIKHIELDLSDIIKDLKEDFKKTKKKKKKKSKKKGNKKGKYETKISLLDSSKQQNITIALKVLERKNLLPDDIANAILNLDEKILNLENIKKILSVIPIDEEFDKYNEFKNDEGLALADKFCFKLKDIPNLKQRLKYWIFKLEVKEKIDDLYEKLKICDDAYDLISENKEFKNLLFLILKIGNTLNTGNRKKSNATGFELTGLELLVNTKSEKTKKSLLTFIVEESMKYNLKALDFKDKFKKILNQVLKIDFNDLKKDIDEIGEKIVNITNYINDIRSRHNPKDKFIEKMEEFLAKLKTEYKKLQTKSENSLKKIKELAEYLQIKKVKDNEVEYLQNLLTFTSDFIKTYEKVIKNQEAEARKKLRMKEKKNSL
ncbi:MAG: hypothetical protein GY830_00035 [Bacteroidetes bacterium]|nr:hypothetical protein [Bacteroidota bacterium]